MTELAVELAKGFPALWPLGYRFNIITTGVKDAGRDGDNLLSVQGSHALKGCSP
jgi:hypothetical protein